MLSTAIKRSRWSTSIPFSRQRPCSMAASASTKPAAASDVKALAPHWPLSFTLQLPKPQPNTLGSYGFASKQAQPPVWWSHRLYRGPEGKEIEIMYSKTKAESEAIAKQFLDESIIGFDMEWPWGFWVEDTLQNKIGLIQIASEEKIGLFHIGLHPGKTTADIIAPTLKKIIEDPKIGKAGVNILKADFSRLSRFFGLKPRGAIELSHLYRLVKFGPRKPEYVSVKLASLAQQVEEQLGLPLYKGDVRTSDWSKPLSKAQIDYAAGDAYAGFMLYKCMNAKRLAMKPTPPAPIYAESYPSGKSSRDDPIILDAGDGKTITTAEFFRVYPVKTGQTKTVSKTTASGTNANPLDDTSQALYDELLVRRSLLAQKASLVPTRIISDILLRAIAHARPHDTPSLLSIKGIGKTQQQRYGDEWLQVIAQFLEAKGIEQPVSVAKSSASKEQESQASQTPRRRVNRQDSPDSLSSVAFEEPAPKPPQLHTGLSFTLAESKLDAGRAITCDGNPESDSDDSLPSLDFGISTSRQLSSSKKRKRIESPRKPHFDSREPHETSPDIKPFDPSDSVLLHIHNTPSAKSVGHIFNEPSLSHAAFLTKSPSTPLKSAPPLQKSPSCPPSPPPQPQASTSSVELSPPSRIAKSKLLAFSRLVTRKLPEPLPPAAPPIVTPHTLDLIVQTRPQTQEELERIPGVDNLILACEKAGMDLLRNVVKFVGERD